MALGAIWRSAATLLLALAGAPVALAAPVRDCPLRDAAFSIDSPLIDIMLSKPATAVIDARAPGFLTRIPPIMTATRIPSFGSIISVRAAANFGSLSSTTLEALDSGLLALPVTAADRAARCARYDDDRPRLKHPAGKVRILLFEKMTGYRDGPSVDAASALFRELARRNHWALVSTDRGGAMRAEVLRRFDIVVWNNVSGDVLTLAQRRAFRAFIERGGGYLGIHGSNGDPVTFWPWYTDTLVGARFIGHPSDPHFQAADIRLEPATGSLGKELPKSWMMTDEWYSFAQSPRITGAKVIATIDEATYQPGANRFTGSKMAMGADHPIAWTRCPARGRAFYTAIGHMPATYADPNFQTLLVNAVDWLASGKC